LEKARPAGLREQSPVRMRLPRLPKRKPGAEASQIAFSFSDEPFLNQTHVNLSVLVA